MISTRRGLLVLLVIAILLGAWLARAVTRERAAPVDRAIVPGLDAARVSELVWDGGSRRGGKVTAEPNGGWRWESGASQAAADGGVVRDVLAALRAARWHRRSSASAAGEVTSRLTVIADGSSTTIGIGRPLEGSEQQWLVVRENALLVDRWVVRALAPDPLAVRVRHVIEDVMAVKRIAIDRGDVHLRLEGPPLRLVAPFVLLPKQDVTGALTRALEALEIVGLSRDARSVDLALSIHAGTQLRFAPACPDDPTRAWLSSDAGNGCITREAYDDVVRAVAMLEQPPAELAERRLVPFDVELVVLADRARLDVARRPAIDGKSADTEAVMELLAALAAPAQILDASGGAAQGQLLVTVKGGAVFAIELLGDGVVRRAGEPLVLRLAPAAYAALNRRAADFADRALWTEEPSTISELVIDGITYRRGAVVGEWTRVPAGPVNGARIEALVAALAEVRDAPAPASLTKRHDVALVVTPPAGAAVRHELVVGAPHQSGCPAYAGQVAVSLPAKVCAEIAALAR